MAYEDELPTKLRMERARVRLTQEQVAARTGLTASAICNYESGKMIPTLQSLSAIADLYGVTLDYLVGRE